MKKFMLFVAVCVIVLVCGTAGAEVKVLVAYFSRSGNTQNMAKIIAEHLREDISVNEYRIIPAEDYPDDFPNPSCLIFGTALSGKILHVVAGTDENYLYVITAYCPSEDKFEKDMKTRRK